MTPAQKNKSALLQAAIALMEARNIGMVTSEEWENLAKSVETESGENIEWRTDDEIADVEEKANRLITVSDLLWHNSLPCADTGARRLRSASRTTRAQTASGAAEFRELRNNIKS